MGNPKHAAHCLVRALEELPPEPEISPEYVSWDLGLPVGPCTCGYSAHQEKERARSKANDASTRSQPPPTEGTGPAIWDLVMEDIVSNPPLHDSTGEPWGDGLRAWVLEQMKSRHQEGIRKYGQPLRLNNGRDHLIDAFQEILDFSVYIRQEIERREKIAHQLTNIRDLYNRSLKMVGEISLYLMSYQEEIKKEAYSKNDQP